MTIAVTGAKGRLGSELLERGCVPLECDISSRDEVREALERVQPLMIINCASYTAVDDCEDNFDDAILANTRGPGVLRTEFEGFFIHISTGYVFDGKAGPYDEEAPPNPISNYGWSKLGGEAAALARQPTLIIRTLDLFGSKKKTDFVRQIRDMLELAQPYQLPTNLYGSPTFIPHLVEGVLAAVSKAETGILNITGDMVVSRYTWGRMIAEAFGFDPDLIEPTDEIKGKAPRPLRGGLLVEKAKSHGIPIFSPEDGLKILAEWSDD
ncbi:MAG: NAD(P)-dependent oxidoreductase [Thermoplasmata archaeon]|nr:NAD(P)-dependent oxidoreductase [Thermoplasmata archaeon]